MNNRQGLGLHRRQIKLNAVTLQPKSMVPAAGFEPTTP